MNAQRTDAPSNGSILKFAVMCNDVILPRWCAQAIEKLLEMDGVCLTLIIRNEQYRPLSTIDKLRRLRPRKFLYHFYRDFIFKPAANRPTDISQIFSRVPTVSCRTEIKGKYSEYFHSHDIDIIRGYDLDFILRFGFNIIRGDILHSARYGVWSTHFDDEEKYRGGPPCFWEIYHDDPVTGAILQRLTNELDAGVILKKEYFQTINYSYRRNFNQIAFGCSYWPAQICADIQNGDASYLDASRSATNTHIYRNPHNHNMLLFILRVTRNWCIYKLRVNSGK